MPHRNSTTITHKGWPAQIPCNADFYFFCVCVFSNNPSIKSFHVYCNVLNWHKKVIA